MQETCSSGKPNAPKNSEALVWDTISLDWPVEQIFVEAQVVTSREPSILEWITVTILQEFEDAPPTSEEAAEKLCIKDPLFITETLKGLLESGAVEQKDPNGKLDLSNCSLTQAGREFLTKRRINSLPEQHGMRLLMDAITGEHLPRPPSRTTEDPQRPVIPPEQLPARRTNIGLDLARQLAKDQNEPFLSPSSQVTDIKVQCEEGSFVWQSIEVLLTIDGAGIIHCTVQAANEQQQQWLDQLDLNHGLFDAAFASALDPAHLHLLSSAKPFSQWRQSIDRLVSAKRISDEACKLVDSARRQIVAHVYWLSLPEVRNQLYLAVDRGARCYVYGQRPHKPEYIDSLPDSVQIIQKDSSPGVHNEIALVTDKAEGLCIDKVKLTTPRKRGIEIIVASLSNALRARQWQRELLRPIALEA